MSEQQSFISRCLDGSALLDELDDYVDRWHETDDSRPLWRFLGMSKDEYSLWVERPEALRYIVAAHRQHRSVDAIIESFATTPVAARADRPEEARKLLRWLEQTGRLS